MQSAIGERGQITIPKAVRRQLGLRPGMRLEVSVENGAVTLRRPGIADAIDAWGGRDRVVTDFLIAAHAHNHATRLIARDRGFFRDHFGDLNVWYPDDLIDTASPE
jgi:AbrB family looped-hinge helix DNA binding protein